MRGVEIVVVVVAVGRTRRVWREKKMGEEEEAYPLQSLRRLRVGEGVEANGAFDKVKERRESNFVEKSKIYRSECDGEASLEICTPYDSWCFYVFFFSIIVIATSIPSAHRGVEVHICIFYFYLHTCKYTYGVSSLL